VGKAIAGSLWLQWSVSIGGFCSRSMFGLDEGDVFEVLEVRRNFSGGF
jgi:hypothetical protein